MPGTLIFGHNFFPFICFNLLQSTSSVYKNVLVKWSTLYIGMYYDVDPISNKRGHMWWLSVTITYRPLCLLQHRYIFEFVYICAEYFLDLYKYLPYLFRKLWRENFLAQHISNAKRPYVMTIIFGPLSPLFVKNVLLRIFFVLICCKVLPLSI